MGRHGQRYKNHRYHESIRHNIEKIRTCNTCAFALSFKKKNTISDMFIVFCLKNHKIGKPKCIDYKPMRCDNCKSLISIEYKKVRHIDSSSTYPKIYDSYKVKCKKVGTFTDKILSNLMKRETPYCSLWELNNIKELKKGK